MQKQKIINRPEYLKWLLNWKNEDVIKVVSGVRRCGKSTLFEIFKQNLTDNGVQPKQIISINFEDFDFDHLREASKLYSYLKEQIKEDVKYYVFLD